MRRMRTLRMRCACAYRCGNFGVLVLDTARVRKKQASALLQVRQCAHLLAR